MKYDIIHIVGASGSGTSTLGQALEQEYGYKWLDTDGYFWQKTDPPFVKSLPHEERVKMMSAAIQEHPKCVITGSLCGWGDEFIPRFDLVVFIDTPTDIRIERLGKREAERFGKRICKGGDMYDNHFEFIEWAKGYDGSTTGRCRKLHEEWFKLLPCPLLRVDGTKPVNELLELIKEKEDAENTYFNNILSCFAIPEPLSILQIYRSAWIVNDDFILKSNANKDEFDKSITLSRLLLSEGVPVIEYLDTTDGRPYVFDDEKYWCLMKRIKGIVFDPFVGEPKHNGSILGKTVAELHIALKNIENRLNIYEADFCKDLLSWIIPELIKGGISFTEGVMENLQVFLQHDYIDLPRQLIHRDIHTSNLLFENGILTGYLDFDMSQINARVFDIVYLGCSLLVENYKDESRLKIWQEIFAGIMQGYNELLSLSEDEIKAIPSLFVFIEVLFTAFYSKTGQLETAKSCVEMTNWMHENVASVLLRII
jgi:Adenylate kinase and related kinases